MSNYREPEETRISTGDYASKWGLSDFYPECEAKLQALLDSKEDFLTEQFGCKKEIHYAEISRKRDTITVWVSCYMDEVEDIINDELNDRDEEFPEDFADVLYNGACDICNYYDEERELPGDATMDDIKTALSDLETIGDAALESRYNELIEYINEECESWLASHPVDSTSES